MGMQTVLTNQMRTVCKGGGWGGETSSVNLYFYFKGGGPKQEPDSKVTPPTHPRSSSPPPVSQTNQEDLQSDVKMDADQCNKTSCSGNGRCVEAEGVTTCVCSEGYSGAACEDRAAKGMQGPVIYGAAGLCAGIVVIAVIAVVLKKKGAETR